MLHVRRYFCNPGAVTNPVHVQVQNGNFGALKFVNSEFQGQPSSIAVIGAGKLAPGENRFELENGTVSFIGCHFGDCKRAALALPVRRVRRVRHWPHAWLSTRTLAQGTITSRQSSSRSLASPRAVAGHSVAPPHSTNAVVS
jgi:hypothetical protein